MIVRIVKLIIDVEELETFLAHFTEYAPKVRGMKGCNHLEVFKDINNPGVCFTYSKWDSEEDLINYKETEVFKIIWKFAKSKFAGKPEAWSVDKILEL